MLKTQQYIKKQLLLSSHYNWLSGLKERPSPIFMQADYPDTITLLHFDEPNEKVRVLCALYSGDSAITIREEAPHVVISDIPVEGLYNLLQACQGQPCELSHKGSKLAHRASEKLATWEFFLSMEAQATKARCSTMGCSGRRFWPISHILDSHRTVASWCDTCHQFISMDIRSED